MIAVGALYIYIYCFYVLNENGQTNTEWREKKHKHTEIPQSEQRLHDLMNGIANGLTPRREREQ